MALPCPYSPEEEALARRVLSSVGGRGEGGGERALEGGQAAGHEGALPPARESLHLPAALLGDLLHCHLFLNSFAPQLKLRRQSVSMADLDRTLGAR